MSIAPAAATRVIWECPRCTTRAATRPPHRVPFHPCRGLRGLSAPMVREGQRCKVEAVERQDYVGKEHVQADGAGRPVMAVVTTRDDGQDCAVYAPAATASLQQ